MGAKVPRGTVFGLCATLVECSGDLPLPSLFDLAPPILNLRGQHMKLAVVADVGLLPPPLQAAMEQPDKLGKGESVQIVDAVRVWAAHLLSGVLKAATLGAALVRQRTA